ncbi:hypothetical protein CORC01_09281 [Colletotrichum orchidophilum]|uniref:U4/U6.U5 small nuclear ribonucleoprotein 27kDa protein domain-containing protein n=1 Tax=Colletotrichum orchidophilum TaxID=1209926 RepID=A0A1G4B1V1_9PEZI|nr:uncharacterized protein CORC01_09281 [Colletotrichum orchidophilum]OHE95409.1 hypothetical protein CORC01_09281 [Colletotrichum orchidophilum]
MGRGRDSRQAWDEPDRRSRHGGGGGPRDRESYRDRDGRRDDRDRKDDGGRRYRSRSRDRRDRDNRPRSRDRESHRPRDDRDGGRPPRRDRGGWQGRDDRRRRDDDEPAADERPPRRQFGDEDEGQNTPRDRDRRRSASPRRSGSPPPPRREPGGYTESLPTRTVPRGKKEQHTMSFKVGRHDSPHVDSGRDSERGDTPMTTGRGDREADEEGDDEPEPEVEDDDMAAMQAMLGFGGFGSTKGQKIAGNNVGTVRKEKKTEYRQYMNRQGGFNRPLSPGR